MPIYKVSYVIADGDHPGAILNQDSLPQKGATVKLGERTFEVVEVLELTPPRGDFHYIHVTLHTQKKPGSPALGGKGS
jgi:hypothetical protein